MTSRLDPKSDEQLTTAIRSAFDDIVFATETRDHPDDHAIRDTGSTELHTPDKAASPTHVEDDSAVLVGASRHRSDRSRWLLSAAAVVTLVVGIGALTTLDNRGTEPEDPTSAPAENTSSGDDASEYRFAEPLASSIVPFLVPAPAQPEVVDRPRSFDWASGITGFSLFAVRQDEQPASPVAVLETAVPWEVISEGLPVEAIGGTAAVVVRSPGETGLFIKNGATTLAIFDAAMLADDEEAPANVSPEAREVGELIAGQSLDAVTGSNRVVQITSFGIGSTAVRYGPETDVETVLFRTALPVSMDDDDVPLAAELVAGMSLADTPGGLAFERVSPTDLIVVVAPNQNLADEALATVQFDDRPSTSDSDQELFYDQVVERGEPSWGRWELATRSEDPTCWNANVTIWGPGNTGDEAGSCRDAGAAGTVPTAFCLDVDDRIVGASTNADAVFDFQSENDPDSFEATIEQTAENVSFQVLATDDRTASPQVEIRVDGTPLDCSI